MSLDPHSVIDLWLVIAIVWTHWLADFVAQTDNMAKNKSKSNKWLSIHVGIYMLFLLPFGVTFAILNGIAHWCVDYFTSRLNSWLYNEKKNIHMFFVGVGFDQAVHYTILFVTAYLLI